MGKAIEMLVLMEIDGEDEEDDGEPHKHKEK